MQRNSGKLCCTMPMRPAVPQSFLSAFGRGLQGAIAADMATIREQMLVNEERRDAIFKGSRGIKENIARCVFSISIGDTQQDATIAQAGQDLVGLLDGDESKREGNLGRTIEDFTEAQLLHQFFLSGKLAGKTEISVPCSDEEYLCACLGVAQHLARYCVGRAIEVDTSSIELCRLLVTSLMEKMLEFDLRNGPLRRKYDGLKYAVKKIENVTYELSLLPAQPAAKKRKLTAQDDQQGATSSEQEPLVDGACFDQIKQRLDVYDKLREEVIKGSRDVQKLSKQAIFSVHRGKLQEAKAQMDKATQIAEPLLAIVASHPTLRNGAFGNSLEEWAEAALTYEWVLNKRVMPMSEMSAMTIVGTDYVGALSDFTGEACRLAVAAASQRDLAAVRQVLDCVLVIEAGMVQLNLCGKYAKKTEAVAGTQRKLSDIVYELSMVSQGARNGRELEQEPQEMLNKKEDD